jgi:PAS domain S-box-containing protein
MPAPADKLPATVPPDTKRRLMQAALAALLLLGAFTALAVLPLGGGQWIQLVRDFGQIAFAAAAAASCAWIAKRSAGRTRLAWSLVASSAAIAAAGDAGQTAYAGWLGSDVQFPSSADLGMLIAFLLAAAGLLAIPAAHQYASGRRTLLDLLMVALAVSFIVGALALPQPGLTSATALMGWIGIAFAVADVALITAILVTARGSLATDRGRMVVLLSGLSVIALSASAAAFLAATKTLPTLGNLFGSGSMYGFALVALAPLFPEPAPAQLQRENPLRLLGLPYFGVVAVAVTAIVSSLAHHGLASYVALPGAGLLVVLLASQVLVYAESRDLLRQSRRAEAKVRERETMLDKIIDNAPQGVAAISTGRRIMSANPSLASILSAPLQVLAGGSLDAFLQPEYVSRVFKGLESAAEGSPDMYKSDCLARRADGNEFWVHWSVNPIRKTDGAIDYFMTTFEDVTAKREAEETAVANLAQLEKLNRLKSEFVSMVSHEFRTGLVGIQGFSELIRDQEMEVTEIRTLAEEINSDAQRLSRMITDMLDFDRLEAGKIRLDLKPLDLNVLVQAALERAQVGTQKHVIRCELQPNLPFVMGDTDRLTQVLTNLLSNAIKYSPDGGEIMVCTRGASGSVEVAVKDHGRGIPPEFINRLFGRYERYEDKHAGKIIGTGLGLAITRQIVEMHGGRIVVESVVGSGSEFRFTVPFATGASSATRSA